jgi:hypothetical protein
LPVLRGNEIVGIITRASLVRVLVLCALARSAHEGLQPSASDRVIRERLFAELKKASLAPIGAIDVAVKD